jgi:hypothetical protein
MMRSRSAPLLVALFALVSAGCSTTMSQVHERHRRYDESEYAPYRARGTGDLTGQARAKNRWGDVRYASEDTVYLFPATPYTDEWWERTLVDGEYLTDPDPRSLEFMRRRVTDHQGRFEFGHLPPGDYYLVCTITWDVYGEDHPVQVLNLGKRVRIVAGDPAHVILEPVSTHRALIDPPDGP